MDIKSEDDQKDFNNNLIKSLKSEEVKTTFFNIFGAYCGSNKTSLKNKGKQNQKRKNPPEDGLMEVEFEKEDFFGNKKKLNYKIIKKRKKNIKHKK